jgi:hypothetical protein
VLQPLTEGLNEPYTLWYEAPYHGRKRQMKLRPAAPTIAQSLLEKCFASNFAIRVHLLLAFHVVQAPRARG